MSQGHSLSEGIVHFTFHKAKTEIHNVSAMRTTPVPTGEFRSATTCQWPNLPIAHLDLLLSDDATGSIKCLFSDIDGTLVHYYENDGEVPPGLPEVVPLPASATGRMGRISVETLRLAAGVRSKGAKLVLVSGVRYSTFATRLPYLPRADAYVIENGGRVFFPNSNAEVFEADGQGGEGEEEGQDRHSKKAKVDAENTEFGNKDKTADGVEEGQEEVSAIGDPSLTAHAAGNLAEDLTWRKRLESVTGPAAQDSKPPSEREGPLWDMYRKAVSEGFDVDTKSYFTMLRVKVGASGKPGGTEAVQDLLGNFPEGLRLVTNFGMVDICPDASGKHNAAAYLATERFGIPLSRCASMGDDDNDIALAKVVGKGAFITTFSSDSVEAASKEDPGRFHVAKEKGVKSSEEMLKLILDGC